MEPPGLDLTAARRRDTVSNLLVEPDVGLPIELSVEVEVVAAEE